MKVSFSYSESRRLALSCLKLKTAVESGAGEVALNLSGMFREGFFVAFRIPS